MTTTSYETSSRIGVRRTIEEIPVLNAIEPVIHALDQRRGVLLASSYEYPGRYTRWDMGFVDPPVVLSARGREFRVEALNARGQVLLPPIADALRATEAVERLVAGDSMLDGAVREPSGRFAEEERSRQPSLFSVLRALVALFHHPDEPHLGLYGAFGYDLAFQFEPIRLRLERPQGQRDLLLYLPDEMIVVDHRREVAQRRRYEFTVGDAPLKDLLGRAAPSPTSDHRVPRPSPIIGPANTRRWCTSRGSHSSAAISSRSSRARRFSKRASRHPPRSFFTSGSATRRRTASC